MKLSATFLESLQGLPGFDRLPFEKIHENGESITSLRVNPSKPIDPSQHFKETGSRVPWCEQGYYLDNRPSFTFDPLFHAGCYYVQEASSMFLEQALRQSGVLSGPVKALDLCAAPGGKSTHIQSLLPDNSMLVSNEVIRSRAFILRDNIIRWGCENVMVTNNDPADFGRLENYFDLVVVDAPCSGSGLFRREPEAFGEWSLNAVTLCAQRQQRILADVLPGLKEGGVLVYSTCSYSEMEDEDILQWLQKEWGMKIISLDTDTNWQIISSGGGYRFWPDQVRGEGFFLCCLQKERDDSGNQSRRPAKKMNPCTRQELEIVKSWARLDGKQVIKNVQTVYAWPEQLADSWSLLLGNLNVIYSGLLLGELVRDKMIPDHALAMSRSYSKNIRLFDVDSESAVRFLQKKDITVSGLSRGWQLLAYSGYPLGWINVLSNRINNYYPKELRILKDK